MRAPSRNSSRLVLGLLLVSGLSAINAADKDKKTAGDPDGDGSEEVYDVVAGVTPPRVIRQVNPAYSPGSRGVRVGGTVTVGLVVTSGGTPRDVRVVQGLDKDIDQSAVDAVKQWRFEPAKKEGKAIAVRITIQIQFRDM